MYFLCEKYAKMHKTNISKFKVFCFIYLPCIMKKAIFHSKSSVLTVSAAHFPGKSYIWRLDQACGGN